MARDPVVTSVLLAPTINVCAIRAGAGRETCGEDVHHGRDGRRVHLRAPGACSRA
jgi:hypothetical protein